MKINSLLKSFITYSSIIFITFTNDLQASSPVEGKPFLKYLKDIKIEKNERIDEFYYADGKVISSNDAISNVVLQYEGKSMGFSINRTYFIPGAGFTKKDYRDVSTFNYELINSSKEALKEDFITVESSIRKIPFLPLRAGLSGRWAILNGYAPLDYNTHKNIKRTVIEIEENFTTSSGESMNIIGSSYGSVVAANTVIALLERDNGIDKIDVLILSASMIDQDSELGIKLKTLQEEEKIAVLYYQVTPNDNITACSGKSKKEARKGFRRVVFNTAPSIINLKKHAHNIASKSPERANEVFDVIIRNSELNWTVDNNDYFTQSK